MLGDSEVSDERIEIHCTCFHYHTVESLRATADSHRPYTDTTATERPEWPPTTSELAGRSNATVML